MTKNEKMCQILNSAKIRFSSVHVLGSFVHVDTYHKYEVALSDLMTNAGFKVHSKSDGRHMDDYVGFRMVFKVSE